MIDTLKMPNMLNAYRVWYNNGALRFWCCRANNEAQARELFGKYFGDVKTITQIETRFEEANDS